MQSCLDASDPPLNHQLLCSLPSRSRAAGARAGPAGATAALEQSLFFSNNGAALCQKSGRNTGQPAMAALARQQQQRQLFLPFGGGSACTAVPSSPEEELRDFFESVSPPISHVDDLLMLLCNDAVGLTLDDLRVLRNRTPTEQVCEPPPARLYPQRPRVPLSPSPALLWSCAFFCLPISLLCSAA